MKEFDLYNFRIETSSNLDYEGMVIDIINSNNIFARLSCDNGIKNAKIEIFHNSEDSPIWIFNYYKLFSSLQMALQKLKEANSIE